MMSAFNGEKFYGYSPVREPSTLSTIPRNFEFKYVRPEQLDKAIKQARVDKSLGEKPATKPKTARNREFSVSDYHHIRDRDVETIMSRNRMHKMRVLSDQEVDEIVLKAKISETRQPVAPPERVPPIFSNTHLTKFLEAMPLSKPFKEVLVEPSSHTSESTLKPDTDAIEEKAFISLTKSVESSLKAVESLLQTREQQKKPPEFFETCELEFRTQKPYYAEIVEKPITDSLFVNEIKKPFLFKNPLGERVTSHLKSASSFESALSFSPKEELDSEAEIDFKLWEKIKSPREIKQFDTYTSEMDLKLPKSSFDYLKNITPVTLTEPTDEADSEQNMKVVIKNKIQIQTKMQESLTEKPNTVAPKTKVPIESTTQWSPKKATVPRPKSQRISEGNRGSVAYSARAPPKKTNGSTTARTQSVSSANSARQMSAKPVSRYLSARQNSGKNIEVLKSQKMEIFQKMSNTQERIIEMLDKINMALLEVYIPTSTQEKNKRQKNAMEFSVRFSRNFLYPLKGMIEDIRVTSPDTLNSANSNEATVRVASIYSLLFQALSTYHKQLRFFLLNQVPHKLSTVLEMIISVTRFCLLKGFFDRNDTIVECMLDRSNKFMEFLSELQQNPEKHEATSVRATNPSRISSKNYELKMCMNDLNMYEPKLMAKRKSRKSANKKCVEVKPVESIVTQIQTQKQTQTRTMSSARKSEELMNLNLENVTTQMMHNEQSEADNDSPKQPLKAEAMVMKLTAALKNATKTQVSTVLQPLLQSFGICSDPQNTENFQTAETIINAFTEEILKIVENSYPTPISSKYKKERKVVTGKTQKGLSKKPAGNNSTHKATSKSLKARKRTKVLRRHKTNNTIAEKSTALNEQAPDDDDTKQINNDDTPRHHMFDINNNNNNNNNNNDNFKLILNESLEIAESEDDEVVEEDEESSEYDSDHEVGKAHNNNDTNADYEAYYVNDGESDIGSQELRHNPTQYFDTLETVQTHSEGEAEDAVYSLDNTTGTGTGTDEEAVKDNIYALNVDALTASSTKLKTTKVPSQTKKVNEKSHLRKTRLYGKKKQRNPLASPPPVPKASPANSVRSAERLELMRRELQKVCNGNDEACLPTHMSMSPINNPKVANAHQMTSDAKLLMTLENIKVPLTEVYFDNMADGVSRSMRNSKKSDRSSRTTQMQEIATNQVTTNYQISRSQNNRLLNTQETPYDIKAWENAMQDLPKVHKDALLKTIMEQERALYAAFMEQEAEKPAKKEDEHDDIDNLFKERNKFLEDCQTNRFYTNPAYKQPWKIFSNIADVITQDIVESVENDFTQGVSKFVQDFVQLETQL